MEMAPTVLKAGCDPAAGQGPLSQPRVGGRCKGAGNKGVSDVVGSATRHS